MSAGSPQESFGEAMERLRRSIRVGRTARRWTLEDLADRSGVSLRALKYIEQGRRRPSMVTLWRLSRAFGVGMDRLISG